MACWIRSLTNISPRPQGTMTLVEPKQTVTFIVSQSHHQRLEHSTSAMWQWYYSNRADRQHRQFSVRRQATTVGLDMGVGYLRAVVVEAVGSSSRCGVFTLPKATRKSGSADQKHDKYHPEWVPKVYLLIILWCAYSRLYLHHRTITITAILKYDNESTTFGLGRRRQRYNIVDRLSGDKIY